MTRPKLEQGRMPCLNCGEPVEFSLDTLFTTKPIPCEACGATMRSQVSRNGRSLDALRQARRLIRNARVAPSSSGPR